MAENPNATLRFCQLNLYDGGQPFSVTASHVFKVCSACLVCEKVVGPKPDQPNRLLRQ